MCATNSGCSSLTSVNIPNSVKSIGERAFYGCSNLTSVNIPNSVTEIEKSVFNGCSNLTFITIPNSVTKIKEYAFYGSKLVSVTIPNSVTSIEPHAFSSVIKTIWLTNTPPSGYKNAAGRINYVANDQFTDIYRQKVYPYLSSMFESDGIKYVPVSPSERTCDAIDCVYGEQSNNIVIAETISYKGIAMKVLDVNSYTFCGNKQITSVEISNKGNIGISAFSECTGLQTAIIKNQGNIEEFAFENCFESEGEGTVIIDIPGEICTKAFYNCPGINKLTIQAKGSIGPSAFYGCSYLENLSIKTEGDIGESAYENSFQKGQDGFVSIETSNTIKYKAFYNCLGIRNLSLKTNGDIGESAFEKCENIEKATIAEGVTFMQSSAFKYCSSLKEIVIPNSVSEIKSDAFAECKALEKVIIGSGVTRIGSYAFDCCRSLPQIEIPENVISIGNCAFLGCSRLANVTIAERATILRLGSNDWTPLFSGCPLKEVYIGGPISYNKSSDYGYSPFYRNTSLKSVTITDTEIEVYDNEFYGCTALKDVKIGDGVTKIGNWAFSGCTSLESFSFGSKTKNIGQEAFSDCTALTQITTRAINPPVCGNQALDDINKWSCTLTVPGQSVSLYQAADQWKEFFFIEANPNAYHAVTLNKDDLVDVYNANGVKVRSNVSKSEIASELPAGMYIINGKKMIVK